jgi:FMN reductase
VSIAVVVGNPKPGSRTLGVATAVARRIAADLGEPEVRALDLVQLGPQLLEFGNASVAAEVRRVQEAALTVFASPTFKASFTGLLKLFFDQISAGALNGRVGVPVMTGGSPTHSLSVEVHLRPVLVELGATLPSPGLYVPESQFPDLDQVVERWWEIAGPSVRRLVAAPD